jgi:hypothetical protein
LLLLGIALLAVQAGAPSLSAIDACGMEPQSMMALK